MKVRVGALVALTMLATGCQSRLAFDTPVAAGPTQVVIVSQAGKLATSTPMGGGTQVPVTPTFDPSFNSLLTPLAQEQAASGTAVAGTATPPLRPTRTPAPSSTPFPTVALPSPALQPVSRDLQGQPTRTPGPPTVTPTERPTRTPTKTSTPFPADPTGDNSDLAHSLAVGVGTDQVGRLNSPQAVDVYSFDVTSDDQVIFVTLSGRSAESYRVYLISPGRQQAAAARPVGSGSIARQIRYPARSEKGTWFVEVTSDGKKVPDSDYTLKIDLRVPVATGGG